MMTEPLDSLNDRTATVPSNANKAGAFLVLLSPPFQASSIQRRAADVMRRQLRWTEGAPPGIYWNGDANPYNPFLVIQNTSGVVQEGGAGGPVLYSSDSESSEEAGPPTPPSASESATQPNTQMIKMPGFFRRRGVIGEYHPDELEGNLEVKGHLIELSASNMHIIRTQVYLMGLTIQQFASNGQWQTTSFRMNIDTGSNTTWILGDGVCEAKHETDSVKQTIKEILLTKWPLDNPPPRHSTLNPNPFLHNPSDRGDILRKPNLPTYIQYTDNSLVLIEQLAEPLIFTVDNFYSWNQLSRWNAPPQTFGYRFAVAYAADESIMYANYDGILGLGPRRQQECFHHSRAEQDFSTALTRQCMPLKSDTEVETYSGGYVYYFRLRPPPQIDISTDPSWISVNQWPCDEIEFSEKIPVQQTSANPSDPFHKWAIKLQSMEFFEIVMKPDNAGTLVRCRASLGRLYFGASGTLFILDTGASTSDLPPDAHVHLKEIFSLENFDQEEQAAGDIRDDVRLRIPPAYCNDETEMVVDFVFLGEGDTQVTVTGPAKPFLYQDSMGECLLYPYSQADETDQYVLGLNFFQAMFVAMHRPGNPARDTPYIRLAPQWPQERYRLRLPPKEGQARDPKGEQVEMDDELMDTDSELTDMEE